MPFFMLHPKDIEQIRRQKNAIIVDLREKADFMKNHYKNACCISYKENECWLDNFRKNTIYILYCDYGNVSLLVARKLSKRGITAYTVVGGMNGIQHFQQQNTNNHNVF